MPASAYPRPYLRSMGMALRLSRIVLGLSQQQAGVLLGVSPKIAKDSVAGYESAMRRPTPARMAGMEQLLERACIYATERFGGALAKSRMPDSNDREYALKLFKYWQEHDGSRAGLRRLIPYLAAAELPRGRVRPLPPALMRPDDIEVSA